MQRRVIVDHVLFVVRDLDASARFYDAALEPLGFTRLSTEPDGIAYGAEGIDDFAISVGAEATTNAHVAFVAESVEAVQAFHAAAVQAGAREKHAPGVRPEYSNRYYAAFVYDPDDNNVEAVFHSDQPLG